MSGLKQLLIDLGRDGDLDSEYIRAPEDVMNRYGLSAEEIKAMLDKDIDKLKRLSGLDTLKSNGSIKSYDDG